MIQTFSPTIRRKEMEAVLTCMVDEKIGPGEMTAKMIQAAKEYIGFDGAVALRSPALALEYALKALDLPKESFVILSALAPSYQILTIEKLGYKALVADVEEETGLVTLESVTSCVNEGGRLLVLPHSMGIVADFDKFAELGIQIIEDVSQAAMAYYKKDSSDGETPQEPKPQLESASESDDSFEQDYGVRVGMKGLYSILGMEDLDIITSGGGALLFAPGRREWTVLKHYAETQPSTDFLPDMNSALAYVEFKEFNRNEKTRRSLYSLFTRAVQGGRHKTFVRGADGLSTLYTFPLVLNSGFKDVKAYAHKKGINISQVYENSIIALRQEELKERCICANSLLLRCAAFPLYPRLSQKDASQIVKVLSSLP